jgi:hypothetical protein
VRLLVGPALVIVWGGLDRDNDTLMGGKNEIAINLPPFVTFRRAPQVVRSIVDLLSAIPVVARHVVTLLPLIVMAITAIVVVLLRLRLIVVILIRMLLR